MGQRFVILRHSVNGGEHFDLMLEVPGQEKLRTWQLAKWPLDPGESCKAREIEPHRRAFLDYEGEISGGRGHVQRVMAGTWRDDGGAIALNDGTRLVFDGARVTFA